LCADIVAITRVPPNPVSLEFLSNALATAIPDAKVTLHSETSEINVQENEYRTQVKVTWLGAWTARKEPEAASPMEIQTTSSTGTSTAADGDTVTPAAPATDVPADTKTETRDDVAADKPVDGAVAASAGSSTNNTGSPAAEVPSQASLEGVNIEACQNALLAIRHMIWFNDHANSANIRGVMRLINDFRARNTVFQSLSPWTTEIIVANALRTNPPNCSISQAVRSVFAYLASGVLLPGIEIVDPCQHNRINVVAPLSAEERLGITALAQEVVRDIAYGKWEKVIG